MVDHFYFPFCNLGSDSGTTCWNMYCLQPFSVRGAFPISIHLNGLQQAFLTSYDAILNCADYKGFSDRKD